ncbi:MAG: glycosyltransferase family 2 protein [Acidobacteria bacterium]|nr:glycosyltransferase family 2 protein [Acidobacteriota bacterium]
MEPDLSVIIVNYNAGAYLERCLRSLDAHLGRTAWEAVVLDNHSIDGSETVVAGFAPRVSLIRNAENIGFGRAVNQGVYATSGRFVLLLNPDGCLLEGAIGQLCEELNAHHDFAVVGPAVVDDDGRIEGSARGDPNMLTGFFGRSAWLRRRFPNAALARRNVLTEPQLAAGESSVEVDWVHGSCMLVRREAFLQVGGFDERYFMYWEDADLCRRLRSTGWHIRYRPDARVAHSGRQSSRTAKALAIRAFHRSAYLYYVTYVAPSPLNPLRWLACGLLGLRCIWRLNRV